VLLALGMNGRESDASANAALQNFWIYDVKEPLDAELIELGVQNPRVRFDG